MTGKESKNSFQAMPGCNSSVNEMIRYGLTQASGVLAASTNTLKDRLAKKLFAVFFAFLIFFPGAAGGAVEDYSYDFHEPDEGEATGFFRPSDHTSKDQQLSSSKTEIEPTSLYLSIDGAEENKEVLIEKGAASQDLNIPLVFNDAVDYYINYFTTTKKDLFKKWLARKKRYAPLMEKVLRQHGLPEDLIYVAMIESGFNLRAYSPKKAAGPWQFIPETGRRYGLTVNHWVDERRHIEKSTIAAARYLQKLFDQFGCWYLAAAGYNVGEQRIDRLIKRHGTNDFWRLRAYNTLPRETREYVPQLIAAALIAKDPEKYGLGVIDEVAAFDFVKEAVPGGVPLRVVAKAASSNLLSIKALNPEIRRGITPPGQNYQIKLPAETDPATFQTSLAATLSKEKRVVRVIRHVTKRRDNLRGITKKYGVSKEDLVLVNGSPLRLKRGSIIYIPRFDKVKENRGTTLTKTANFRKKSIRSGVRKETKSRQSATHVVKRGETLSTIAAKYGLSVRTLKRINSLKTDRIYQGRKLTLVSSVRKVSRSAAKKYHTVRKGDTLSLIGKKYGKSVRALMNMNRLKSSRIQKGMRLRVSSFEGVSGVGFCLESGLVSFYTTSKEA